MFEPEEGFMVGCATTEAVSAPKEMGEHGFWPTRFDYRSVYVAWGPGVAARSEPPIDMLDIRDRPAGLLGLACPNRIEPAKT